MVKTSCLGLFFHSWPTTAYYDLPQRFQEKKISWEYRDASSTQKAYFAEQIQRCHFNLLIPSSSAK